MRIVTAQELQGWLAHGTVLEKDSRGPKVVHLENGLILKIFHTRRHPWFARLNPPAQRFAQNAETLDELSIPVPRVIETVWLDRARGLSACIYQPLPGISLERLYRRSPTKLINMLSELSAFIHALHQRGIYFRSLHLGNILHLPDGRFGLIDFLDIKFKNGALSSRLASRNLKHLYSYLQRRKVDQFPWQEFLQEYSRR